MSAVASRRRDALLASASGVVFASTSPPTDLTLGVFVGLALFAASLEDVAEQPAHTVALRGFLFGLGANLVALRFVPEVVVRFTPLPFAAAVLALVLLAAGQSVPWVLGALAMREVRTRLHAPSWLAFATAIYVATFVPAIFPWTPAGGVARWPLLLQGAEVVGERGVSFVFAAVSALVATGGVRAWRLRRATREVVTPLVAATLLVASLLAFGLLRTRQVAEARARAKVATVALLQPGFDAHDRWDEGRAATMIDRLTKLTRAAEARGAELTVWPESAYPYTIARRSRRAPTGAKAVLQDGVRGPVLTGAYMSAGQGLGTNAAFLATADGAISAPYEKRHLLWFGETVPLADVFPWLRRVFARGTGLVPGTEHVLFETGAIRAAVLNCYEDTLPAAGREAMAVGPNLLVNVTNDAWFSGSSEGELHLRLAVLRAIETRRDLVRAVNEGPTTFVDATGRILARYDAPLPGPLLVRPALLEGPLSPYARLGDALPVVLLGAALLGIAAGARRRNTSRA